MFCSSRGLNEEEGLKYENLEAVILEESHIVNRVMSPFRVPTSDLLLLYERGHPGHMPSRTSFYLVSRKRSIALEQSTMYLPGPASYFYNGVSYFG